MNIKPLIEEVSKLLPGYSIPDKTASPDWDNDHYAILKNDNGKSISFFYDVRKKRVEINPVWLRGEHNEILPYRERCDSITVSAEKPAEKIAKDIQRRLLPDYDAAFERGRVEKESQDRSSKSRNETIAKVEAILETKKSTHSDNTVHAYHRANSSSVDCRVSYDGSSVELKFSSVSKEIALKILALYKEESKLTGA